MTSWKRPPRSHWRREGIRGFPASHRLRERRALSDGAIRRKLGITIGRLDTPPPPTPFRRFAGVKTTCRNVRFGPER